MSDYQLVAFGILVFLTGFTTGMARFAGRPRAIPWNKASYSILAKVSGDNGDEYLVLKDENWLTPGHHNKPTFYRLPKNRVKIIEGVDGKKLVVS